MYGTLAAADTYHATLGNAAWSTGTDPARTAALERATQYIDARYREKLRSGRWVSMFVGQRTAGRDQPLEWPRTEAMDYEGNAIADNVVPVEVEHATYTAALVELANPGSLSPSYTPTDRRERVKVGPVEVQYAIDNSMGPDGRSPPNRPVIPLVDELLAPVLVKRFDYPGVTVV